MIGSVRRRSTGAREVAALVAVAVGCLLPLSGCASKPPATPSTPPPEAVPEDEPEYFLGEVVSSECAEGERVDPVDFPSCDGAVSEYVESYDMAAKGGEPPDLTASAYGEVLGKGTYLAQCGVPETTGVEVCVAVREGEARGVTVALEPEDQCLANCLVERIRELSFPAHPRMDVTRTSFQASP